MKPNGPFGFPSLVFLSLVSLTFDRGFMMKRHWKRRQGATAIAQRPTAQRPLPASLNATTALPDRGKRHPTT